MLEAIRLYLEIHLANVGATHEGSHVLLICFACMSYFACLYLLMITRTSLQYAARLMNILYTCPSRPLDFTAVPAAIAARWTGLLMHFSHLCCRAFVELLEQ